jgi:histidine kinase/DNA gyrase B/HSP90-like ATPase
MGASLGPTKSGNGASRSPKPPRLAPVKDPQAVKSADFIKSGQNELKNKPAYKAAKILDSYKIEQQDWVLFTSPNTLPQQAGVPLRHIRRLVLKELVDNALDMVRHLGAAGEVSIHKDDPHTFTVRDNGPGLHGTPEQIASLFSLNRPMTSSKRWRRRTRGAIGNGLRVVTGSVISAVGRIVVCTRNQRITLRPQIEDGSTTVEKVEAINFPVGTAITVEIDPIYE